MKDLSIIPHTYLFPVVDFEEIRLACFEERGNITSVRGEKINEIATHFDRDVSIDDEVTWAGFIGLEGADVFAEYYDPMRYSDNAEYLEDDTMLALMSLPAIRETLLQLEKQIPMLLASNQDVYPRLSTPELSALISSLRAICELFTLPKLPFEINVEHIDDSEGDYTFRVLQRYSGKSFLVFESADGFIGRDELLHAFLLYARFSGTLPAFLQRYDDGVDAPLLLGALQDLKDGFVTTNEEYRTLTA